MRILIECYLFSSSMLARVNEEFVSVFNERAIHSLALYFSMKLMRFVLKEVKWMCVFVDRVCLKYECILLNKCCLGIWSFWSTCR